MVDMLRIKKDGWWIMAPYIKSREAFKTHGAMKAVEIPPGYGYPTLGKLPAEYKHSAERAAYIVYSYQTPIAWWSESDGWTVPLVKYSVTTSVHQGKVRTALINVEYAE